ncbi:MAG: L-serine ammonia-lyase [Clostridia bacterium]|nr:L-serine ammonia-lyase [Clostridia bacterium]
MKSLRELYKIGAGPSSSHTIGPERAAERMRALYPDARGFAVTLYGSLALTGRGHGTDAVLRRVLGERTEIRFDTETTDLPHPNTMDITAILAHGEITTRRIYSVGGGAVQFEGEAGYTPPEVYAEGSFEEILRICEQNDWRLSDYVFDREADMRSYLLTVWEQMKESVRAGLAAEGILPGGLNVQRKAKLLYNQRHIDETPETKENRLVCAYAFAVAEQNAAGGHIVTAPTCGAGGVIPAVMYYMQKKRGFSDEEIVRALAAAGVVGNLIKTNASISGAECGCQAEIGSACSMAAAGLGELFDMRISQVEYAAEVAMEHHLGLTCDPVYGLVQIPCIERNAVAAMRAINAVSLAGFLSETRKISLDKVIETMYETGKDMSHRYRETSEGGLAKLYDAPNEGGRA